MSSSLYKTLLLLFFSVLSLGLKAQLSSDSLVSLFQLSSAQTTQLKEIMQKFQLSKEDISSKSGITFEQREGMLKNAQMSAEEQLMGIFNLKQKMMYLEVLSKKGLLNNSTLNQRKTDYISNDLKDTLHLDHDQTTTVYSAIHLYLEARSDLKMAEDKNAKVFAKADAAAYKEMLKNISAVLNADQKKKFLLICKRKKGKSGAANYIS
jgi:hypothetical protein